MKNKKTEPRIEVRIGQLWRDRDPRRTRTVRVIGVSEESASVSSTRVVVAGRSPEV